MANFNIGSRVRLKSGGPIMTVANVGVGVSGEEIECVWFVGNKKMNGSFPPDTLDEIVSPTQTRPTYRFAVTRKGL